MIHTTEPFSAVPLQSVLYNTSLSDFEARLIGAICALDDKDGFCYAGNRWLAEKLGKSMAHVSRVISSLTKREILRIEFEKLPSGYVQRKIFVGEKTTVEIAVANPVPCAKVHTPLSMDVQPPMHGCVPIIRNINNKGNNKANRESPPGTLPLSLSQNVIERFKEAFPNKALDVPAFDTEKYDIDFLIAAVRERPFLQQPNISLKSLLRIYDKIKDGGYKPFENQTSKKKKSMEFKEYAYSDDELKRILDNLDIEKCYEED